MMGRSPGFGLLSLPALAWNRALHYPRILAGEGRGANMKNGIVIGNNRPPPKPKEV